MVLVELLPKHAYRKVRSDGPPVAKLDRPYYPLFDFNIDEYGVLMMKQTLVEYLKAIFISIKGK